MIRFLLLALLFFAPPADARLMRAFSFAELQSLADIVVVAIPTATVELSEHVPLPNIRTVDDAGKEKPVMGVGLNTQFKILSILKGDAALKEITLHHYRLAAEGLQLNGPGLVSFNPGLRTPWLLYLKRAGDVYEPVSGQTDPDIAVRKIEGGYFEPSR